MTRIGAFLLLAACGPVLELGGDCGAPCEPCGADECPELVAYCVSVESNAQAYQCEPAGLSCWDGWGDSKLGSCCCETGNCLP